ncbi:MAG: 50S ribosomal protein L11 methyltransferase [Desulfuromonas sp.]|nr:MAG: 50S ribosomal protein L11 methyltransferase [Desulfuromonas sp.]
MELSWTETVFSVPVELIDQVSDALYGIGCIGVMVEERDLDTFVAPDPDADLPESYEIRAYFPETAEPGKLALSICRGLAAEMPGLTPAAIRFSGVQQEDWAEGWKQHFSTVRFGSRLVVKPTWEQWQGDDDSALVSLDPGMAFGTGSHETTRLCLQAVADRFEQSPAPDSVLDVGTGSGILAIAAAALGASKVIGCEIDPGACRVAEENVMLNRVAGQVEITGRPLPDIAGHYDLVIANILAEENVRLAVDLVAHLAPGGCLILSGILKEKESFVCAGFCNLGLNDPDIRYENEWCCMIYHREQRS